MLTMSAAAALLDHLSGGALHAEEGALQVDADDQVELSLGRVEHRGARLHAGVVDQHVEVAAGLDRLVDQPLDVGHARHVALQRLGPAAALLDLLHRGVGRRLVLVVVDGDRGAGLAEREADGVTDAAVAAGDDRRLACQGHRALLVCRGVCGCSHELAASGGRAGRRRWRLTAHPPKALADTSVGRSAGQSRLAIPSRPNTVCVLIVSVLTFTALVCPRTIEGGAPCPRT